MTLGIPETVYSDNGLQFSAREFAIFSNEGELVPAHNQLAVPLPVECESRVKCQIGEETLETSSRFTTSAVRIQKHDYSWYDTKPMQRLLHRSTRSIISQLDCGRTDDKSNRTEKERELRRTQYHYKHLYCFSPVWIRTCFFKLPLSANCAPQESHL